MNDLGLERWNDFYLIVGGAAAGLTGLMFVVVTLAPRVIASSGTLGVRSFDTPTVVFFTTSTVVSALMMIPIITGHALAGVLIASGVLGLAYMFVIGAHRALKRHDLLPEDWAWYLVVPIVAYAALATGGILLWVHTEYALLVIGLTALLFMVIGVRNAWDLVLYMAKEENRKK